MLVRYIVDDVDAALAFYTTHLGFQVVTHPAPGFAMLAHGAMRLALSAPGKSGRSGQPISDTHVPEPGGWKRISVPVTDLDSEAATLSAWPRFRNDIDAGGGGMTWPGVEPDLTAWADQRIAGAGEFLDHIVHDCRADVAANGSDDSMAVSALSAHLDEKLTAAGEMSDVLALAIRRLAAR